MTDREGRPTTADCVIVSRRRLLGGVLSTALTSLLTGCNMNKAAKPKTSLSELSLYINVPSWASSCEWELITLPEVGVSDFPGRTDYVVLLALMHPATQTSTDISLSLLKLAATAPVQPQFVRGWLPSIASSTLAKIGTGAHQLYDAKQWVKRPSKRAFAVESANGVLMYVEYVSP